eukprot:TRINITY_DN677_c0_g1_i4.p1 TRINITY_DN677_c0_g1~~TRINITY_DN677_c0_g1_i4.p1  ORF type:complete len:306 (-),score=54.44 TRINITY_DN677_c0_g1_i4:2863-3780(-)
MTTPTAQRQRSRFPLTFVPAVPLTADHRAVRLHSSPVTPLRHRPSRRTADRRSPLPSMSSNENQPSPSVWRRFLAITTLSASMVFAPLPLSRQRAPDRFHLPSPPTALAVPATRTATSTTNTSDVETAFMTLAAVSLGGLIMRAIVRSRQNDEAYRKKVLEDSRRLQEEENLRALRIKRTEMEAVENDETSEDDDDEFMKAFRERVSDLQTDGEKEPNEDKDASDKYGKQELDLVNTQDRGTGSAVLDKPDNEGPAASSASQSDQTQDSESDRDDADVVPPSMAKPEQAEMLKRMWNLNSFDKNE